MTDFATIKYEQGGRDVYAAATRIGDIIAMLAEREDPEVIADANRRLFPAHASEFGEYLWETDDWLSGPLMVGISAADFRSARGSGRSGTLTVPDDATRHLFDGQHRVHGMRRKLQREQDTLAAMVAADSNEEDIAWRAGHIKALLESVIPTVFYVEPDIDALRQMYSDISHVRPPDAITSARFDRRNPFNVAARALAESHVLLTGRVDMERNTLPAKAEGLVTLNQLASILQICWYGSTRRHPASEPDPAEVADRGELFLDALLRISPTLKRIADEDTTPLDAREGNILMASVTMLKVLANIWHDLVFVQNQPAIRVLDYMTELPERVEPDTVWEEAGMPIGAKAPLGRGQVEAAFTLAMSGYADDEAAG